MTDAKCKCGKSAQTFIYLKKEEIDRKWEGDCCMEIKPIAPAAPIADKPKQPQEPKKAAKKKDSPKEEPKDEQK